MSRQRERENVFRWEAQGDGSENSPGPLWPTGGDRVRSVSGNIVDRKVRSHRLGAKVII